MKKILFMLAAAVCTLVACDPVQEDFKNGGNITLDQFKEMSSVSLDKSADGQNGNVLTCSTSAPVNARWSVDGKEIQIGNYAWKKLKLGEHTVTMEGLCADGTKLSADYPINVQTITNQLDRFYVYDGEPFTVAASDDAAPTRFSTNEGKHFPYITDDVYWGFKTLIFEILEAKAGEGIWGKSGAPLLRVMNGWWSATYADDVEIKTGLWELPITEAIAKDCAQGNGGGGKDLTLLVTCGTITFGKVYYEE